jgi:hypothetical protein
MIMPFLIDGILELLQCRWRDGDLDFALESGRGCCWTSSRIAQAGGFYLHRPMITNR